MTFTLRYDEMRVFRVKVKNWTLFEVSKKKQKKKTKVPLKAKINNGLHFVIDFTVAHAVQTQR